MNNIINANNFDIENISIKKSKKNEGMWFIKYDSDKFYISSYGLILSDKIYKNNNFLYIDIVLEKENHLYDVIESIDLIVSNNIGYDIRQVSYEYIPSGRPSLLYNNVKVLSIKENIEDIEFYNSDDEQINYSTIERLSKCSIILECAKVFRENGNENGREKIYIEWKIHQLKTHNGKENKTLTEENYIESEGFEKCILTDSEEEN